MLPRQTARDPGTTAEEFQAHDKWNGDEPKPGRVIRNYGTTPGALTKAFVDTAALSVQHSVQMQAITYTAARESLASTMDQVCRDRAPVIITRNREQAVVMLSLEEYESLEETAHLLRSPANAKRLLASIAALESGKGKTRKIDLES